VANILLIGGGQLGFSLAKALAQSGHQVTVIKRTKITDYPGINFIAADISDDQMLASLSITADAVFFIIAADSRTEADYRKVYQTGLRNVLEKFSYCPWFFVSSTSVYGQDQGEWVDENSVTQPKAITSQLLLQAEHQVLAARSDNVIARFAGIYGPGREYLLRLARSVPHIQQTPPYYTNRIHQTDAVAVLAFLLKQRLQGVDLDNCYLACDNEPAPLWDVMQWLSTRLGCAPPLAKPLDVSTTQNKRCLNTRLTALGFEFIYPSYQTGYLELLS